MPESKFLNYVGLQTYTNYVKNYVDLKEELLSATVSGNNLIADSIDTHVYNGKKVVVWVDQNISSTSEKTLTLNFSEGETHTASIYFRPGRTLTNEYPAGPIKLTYLENVSFRNASYSGWFCDADADINTDTNVTNNATTLKFYLTGSTSTSNTTGGLVKRSTIYVDTDGHLYDNGNQIPSVPIDSSSINALNW